MPTISLENDKAIVAAVKAGELDEALVDLCAERTVELILKSQKRTIAKDTKPGHHALAKRAERESAVLLKNDECLLPGNLSQKAAVIGAFAKTPRYQGAGSSKINPTRLECAFDELVRIGLSFDYAEGYRLESDKPDEALLEEACKVAVDKDIVYVFAGLPDRYESEGFDRMTLSMPQSHIELIRRLSAINPNIAVILSGGSVIDMNWQQHAKAILMGYLGGQAGAGAIAELLLGIANPCGKLTESWPMNLEENPSAAYFPGYPRSVEYRESIFVGYRYYDTAGKAVRYPFGFGLSYTTFSYDDLRISGSCKDGLTVTAEITNTGRFEGAEIVQLYIAPPESVLFKAAQELKGFVKVFLKPGERASVSFTLCKRDFAFYDVVPHDWRVEDGRYEIRLSASSRDTRLKETVRIEPTQKFATPIADYRERAACYFDLSGGIDSVSDEAFLAVYGGELPPKDRKPGSDHTRNSTFSEIQDKWLGRKLVMLMNQKIAGITSNDESMSAMLDATLKEAPLRMLLMFAGEQFSPGKLDGLVNILNGKWLTGMLKFLAKN